MAPVPGGHRDWSGQAHRLFDEGTGQWKDNLLLPHFFLAHHYCLHVFHLCVWKRRKGVNISSALGIVHFVSRPRSCSSLARHLSCLLCRVVLVPPDISFACPASSPLLHGLYCLHVFPNTVSTTSFPLPLWWRILYFCLVVSQNTYVVAGDAVTKCISCTMLLAGLC